MANTTLDMMEYASDGTAQAAYVTNGGYTTNKIPTMTGPTSPSGVASASSEYDANYPAWHAMGSSGNQAYPWITAAGQGNTGWIQYQFTSPKIINKYTMQAREGGRTPNQWDIQGSNNGSSWTTVDSRSGISWATYESKTFTFTTYNSNAYTYYRMYGTATGSDGYVCLEWFQLMEYTYQTFTESTIKTQGSYALKLAANTDAINLTSTRTIGSPIDLTGKGKIKFSIYSSRTGSNIKIGIRDSGGTTTETTPNITSAGAWQTISWDISAVSTANKDAIDRIIITVVNADAANIFYIDNMYAEPDIVTIDMMEYASDGTAQAAYVTNGTSDVATYSSGINTTYSQWPNYTIRNLISASLISTSGTQVKVLFHSGTSSCRIISAYIGTSGGTYNFNGDQVQLLFSSSGDSGVFTGTKESDWVTFSLNEASDLCVATALGSNAYCYGIYTSSVNEYTIAGSHASETNPGGGWGDQGARIELVSVITVKSTNLQSYSEATIKTQGSYALKGSATTASGTKTLTRTIT